MFRNLQFVIRSRTAWGIILFAILMFGMATGGGRNPAVIADCESENSAIAGDSAESTPPVISPKTDLTQTDKEIVDAIEAVLRAEGIAPIDIEREEPEIQEDDQTRWSHTRLKAPLPPSHTIEELELLFRDALAWPEIRVATRLGMQGTITVAVSYAGRECADIVFLRMRPLDVADDIPPVRLPTLRRLDPHVFDAARLPNIEDLPLDSSGLSDIELSKKIGAVRVHWKRMTPPRVAIIVDDGGHGGEVTETILALDPGLTLALLPDTLFVESTAARAAALGFEIMLHIPCENAGPVRQLRAGMTSEKMRAFVEDALGQVPGAVGINNHMGSSFTANEEAMTTFFGVIPAGASPASASDPDRPLFFIDSRTTDRSKVLAAAKKCGIRAAARDVFLDNTNTLEYIRGQFNQLMAVAKAQGQAIGICHFRHGTAQALVVLLPELEKNGIELVHVSELVP